MVPVGDCSGVSGWVIGWLGAVIGGSNVGSPKSVGGADDAGRGEGVPGTTAAEGKVVAAGAAGWRGMPTTGARDGAAATGAVGDEAAVPIGSMVGFEGSPAVGEDTALGRVAASRGGMANAAKQSPKTMMPCEPIFESLAGVSACRWQTALVARRMDVQKSAT